MPSGKAKFWRRRGGSSRMSLMSNQSLETRTLIDVEEEFLHAAEFGDIPTVRRLLAENTELNVDCIDALGRTALRLAVKNEHLEVVEVLLDKSSSRHIYEAVLQAISAGHVQIAESILKHKRYLELWKDRKKFGDDDHFFKTQFEESQFSPDITPLILAAQKNQYEIVQLLLLRGEKIQKPHKFGCLCQECVNKMKFDQLRSAKYRLNAYRGMASEAYISLSSKDPILTAFQLSKELKKLSRSEKYFKQEYKELSNQLSEYVVKLLDRVRTQEELDLVLNKTGSASDERYSTLARLSLALTYMEKKFVAHPSCQQRLDKSWYEGIGPFLKAGLVKRLLMVLLFIVLYPFLTLIYIFAPKANFKCLKVLRFPWVKFVVHSASFTAFLLMIVISTAESSYVLRQNNTLGSKYPSVHEKYKYMTNASASFWFGKDIPIRQMFPTTIELLISTWVIGFLYHECTQMYNEGIGLYCSSLYNIIDYSLLMVYTSSFTLRYLVMFKVHIALAYFKSTDALQTIANAMTTHYNLYWITADRFYWDSWDPINISEGLFAIANILSFSRITYLLPANEALGPLQISLGRMIKDILKCLCLLLGVLVAFVIGLQNLYWYYNIRESIEVERHDFNVPAQEFFGNSIATFRTCFWSVFGRGESSVVTLGQFENHVTADIGYIIYGLYNIIMVTVLINMLIAMMARSFQAITEESDVEWKFARSKLYMEYISDEELLPVPINLVRIPRSIFEWIFSCCDKEKEEEEPQDEPVENGNGWVGAGSINMGYTNGNGSLQNIAQVASRLKNLQETARDIADPSAVDIYEANASIKNDDESSVGRAKGRRPPKRTSIPGFLDGSKSYQRVMQRIIQRYIFDIQREAEVTEDDFEEIKQDISSFRYEMLSVMRSRDQQISDVNNALAKVSSCLIALGGGEQAEALLRKSSQRKSKGSGRYSKETRESLSSAHCEDLSEEHLKHVEQEEDEVIEVAEKTKTDTNESTINLAERIDNTIQEAKTDDEEECCIIDN